MVFPREIMNLEWWLILWDSVNLHDWRRSFRALFQGHKTFRCLHTMMEEMTDLRWWSAFLDQHDYIKMLNLDILICLWELFVPHKSHRNIFKELPQEAAASFLSKEKQSQGVICLIFKQNDPFMNWHWMVSSSDIRGILKQRCILWLTSAYKSKELYLSLLTYFSYLNV